MNDVAFEPLTPWIKAHKAMFTLITNRVRRSIHNGIFRILRFFDTLKSRSIGAALLECGNSSDADFLETLVGNAVLRNDLRCGIIDRASKLLGFILKGKRWSLY